MAGAMPVGCEVLADEPGGGVFTGDVTPTQLLPPDSPYRTDDPKRRFFFTDPRLVSTEVVLPDLQNSLPVGTRVR